MSYTSSSTFTRTNARYIAGKIAADLKQLQLLYGRPSDSDIDHYVEEATELLVAGYLKTVEYGFRNGGEWVLSLRYEVRNSALTDSGPGRVYPSAQVEPSTFYSYLTYTSAFHALGSEQRQAIKNALPIQRTGADEPGYTGGYWETGTSYSSGGVGAERTMWRPS